MNTEIQKSFFVKLISLSLLGAVAWYMIVGSRLKLEQEARQEHAEQIKAITQGEQAIDQHADQVSLSVESMSMIRDELIIQLNVDGSSNVQKNLQSSAENYNLTVSRIEPLRKSISKHTDENNENEIQLETSEFRIECVGSFSGLVGFVEELSVGSTISKVGSFRILPLSSSSARMILQVSMFQLIKTPEAFTESFRETEQLVGAGANDDE